MIAGESVTAIVPARGGSKGLPGKNLALVGGLTLIARTIQCAKGSQFIDRVVVSTDSANIANEALACGAELPFMRPAELAQDETPAAEVIRHAVEMLELHNGWLVLLQPTSPLRLSGDIDACLQLAASGPTGSVAVSVQIMKKSPLWMFWRREDGTLSPLLPDGLLPRRRQDVPSACVLNGAVYVTSVRSFLSSGFRLEKALAHIMPEERSVDIDTAEDLARAEEILRGSHPETS